MQVEGNTLLTYVIFSFFTIVAFLGNVLVIYVLVTRSSYLKQPYNICILNLAIIDTITVVFLVFSRFLYLPPTPKDDIAGEVFCRTIWSAWIVFCLGYISIYTCLVLTIERWLAVVKPFFYITIKPKHTILALLLVWLLGPAVNTTTLFRAKYLAAKQQCTWTTLAVGNDELPWMDFSLQSIIPFITMVFLYSHIYYTMKRLPKISSHRGIQLKKITIVALAASSALVVGWLPGRITFMLTKFGILDANGVINVSCVMITFLNSCVNPFLYGVYSAQFRREYSVIFDKILPCFSSTTTAPAFTKTPNLKPRVPP